MWQRGYYEHIARDRDDLARVRCYIAANPARHPGRTFRYNRTAPLAPGAGAGEPKPQRLFEPPAGVQDDLKLISGIGPGLERSLNAMGITTWAQVAALTPAEIAKVEAELGFRGRATRDNWRAQAEALARGGVEEYRRVFGRAPR